MDTRPAVSVIYVSWNTAAELRASLEALRAERGPAGLEFIVVDNASADGTPEMVRDEFPRVRLIANPDNRGFATAVNQGWRAARGHLCLVLNPDVRVPAGVVQALAGFLEAAPRVGVCAPVLSDEEGGDTQGSRQFACLTQRLDRRVRARPHGALLEAPVGEWGRAVRAHWLMGACMMIRREALEETGGFDEGFFLYGEDMDWCLRALRAGWEVALLPDLEAVHMGARSAAQVAPRLTTWRYYDGYFRFIANAHGGVVARANFLWWLGKSALSSAVLAPLSLAVPRLRPRLAFEAGRLSFCLHHLGRPFWLCRFGRNHPG